MFKKILTGILFSPSLIERIDDYAKALRREYTLRLAGVILLILGSTVHIIGGTYLSSGRQLSILPFISLRLSFLIILIVVALATFLTIRARILGKELQIIRKAGRSGSGIF